MKKSKKARTLMFLIFAIASIAIIFQNCSQVQFGQGDAYNREGNIDISRIHVSLAVSNGACVNCHSVIIGNYVTDYASTGAPVDFLISGDPANSTPPGYYGQGEYIWYNWDTYGNTSFTGTSFINGTIIVPKVNLASRTQADLMRLIHDSKQSMPTLKANENFGIETPAPPATPITLLATVPAASVLAANAPEAVTTVAQYVNSVTNYRTNEYIGVLANWPIFPGKTILPNTQIREVTSVSIGAPSAAMIRVLLPPGQKILYIPTAGSSLSFSNFGLGPNGLYYTNTLGAPMVCDGDLIVDAPVFLNSLILQTQTGCHIYSTASIFVQAAAGAASRQGIQYVGSGPLQNLQLSSAVEVALGLGECSLPTASNAYHARISWEIADGAELGLQQNISASLGDYNNIVDGSGNELLQDASPTCGAYSDPARLVSFQHLLLNAPRIDSRYTGDFDGVIITKFLLWSRGMFHFQYDSTFDSVSILPKIPPSSFFAVTDCQTNGVDNSKVIDTKFRSCN